MADSAHVNTFAGNPLDRASERRGDRDWISQRLDDPETLVAALWNGQLLVDAAPAGDQDGGARLAYLPAGLARALVSDEGTLFLGLGDRAAVFAVDLEGSADPSAGPLSGFGRFEALRALAPRLSGAEAAIAATAKAMFEWRRRHGFCGVCGQPTRAAEAGWKRVCEGCRAEHFPRTDPVVIMLPTFGDRCLLGRQAAWPAGLFSALAGFMEPGESLEEACARELREESGLSAVSVRYHSSQPWPFPASLMIGMFAEVADDNAAPDQTELEAVRWFTRDEARSLLRGEGIDVTSPPPLAIAHHLIKAWANA